MGMTNSETRISDYVKMTMTADTELYQHPVSFVPDTGELIWIRHMTAYLFNASVTLRESLEGYFVH